MRMEGAGEVAQHCLLEQRILVWFPSSLFWPPWALITYVLHIHPFRQNTHIHQVKRDKSLKMRTKSKGSEISAT